MSRWPPRISSPGSGGGPPPIEGADHFAPRYIVGNVPAGDPALAQPAPFRYIPDPGDGTGIALAVSEATASPGDIWIRPGTYAWAGADRISIPGNRRVYGAGPALTTIVNSANDNTMFELAGGAQLLNMTINHVGTLGAKGTALVQISSPGALVDNVVLNLSAATAGGSLTSGILVAGGTGSHIASILRRIAISLPGGIAGFSPTSWIAGIRGNTLVATVHHCNVEDVYITSGDAGVMTDGVEMNLDGVTVVGCYNVGLYANGGRMNASGRPSFVLLTKSGELAGIALLNSTHIMRGLRIASNNAQTIPAALVTAAVTADLDGLEIGTGFNPGIKLGAGAETVLDTMVRNCRFALGAGVVPVALGAGCSNTQVIGNTSRGSGGTLPTDLGTGTNQALNIWGA